VNASAQVAVAPAGADPRDWASIEEETIRHFQALLRLDTSNPPGNETLAAEYLKEVLEREGIPVQLFALEPDRANLVATLEGTGRSAPLLLMGHTDVVTVFPERWPTRPSARSATAATSTAGARWTTRTTSSAR
jgi:acetylornithine deacetylase/succinyl-diaminopimelate desuccinylase-like protein